MKCCEHCRHCITTTIYKRCPHSEMKKTIGDDGIIRQTNVLSVWVRPNFMEFEKIGVCELNHCETQDDHLCDHFEEKNPLNVDALYERMNSRIEIIKRPTKWDNMRAEQEAYEHLNPAEVEE